MMDAPEPNVSDCVLSNDDGIGGLKDPDIRSRVRGNQFECFRGFLSVIDVIMANRAGATLPGTAIEPVTA